MERGEFKPKTWYTMKDTITIAIRLLFDETLVILKWFIAIFLLNKKR